MTTTGFMTTQCQKTSVKVRPADEYAAAYSRPRTVQEIDELEQSLLEIEARLGQMNVSTDTLNKRFLELTELRHVLRETAFFFEEARWLSGDGR
jgi:V-type H+-transporting ATPase subunit a